MPEEADQSSLSSNGRSEGVHTSSALAQVAAALQGLKYGQITITVQDGVVVQIERLERMRLNRRAP